MTKEILAGNPGETGQPSTGLSSRQLLEAYRLMLTIRAFEEQIVAWVNEGRNLVRGSTHVYTGEEAIAVGAVLALNADDYVVSTHRGHGHCLAKGADTVRMFAELLGREAGYCQGKGGSMHIADFQRNILGANGIVGAGIPIAAGAALAAQCAGNGRTTLCFFGDGASNQGTFHETINVAAVWKLPVIFLCENNGYAVSTHCRRVLSVERISVRATSYGIPGETVDGNDVEAVYRSVAGAVARARAGEGPSLIEAITYRFHGHYVGDPGRYRSREEVEAAKRNDPLPRLRARLLERGLREAELTELERDVEIKIQEATEQSLSLPPPNSHAAREKIYAAPWRSAADWGPLMPPRPRAALCMEGKAANLSYARAIGIALKEAMSEDPSVVILGEDIGVHGGAFGVTHRLLHDFGELRVRDCPISESAIAGCAIGAALAGLRPVAEIMYVDFSTLATDQIINQAAKLRYMSGGQAQVPVVIRTQGGGGRGNAGQHSQSLEAWYAHTPGLKVVMPSTPQDAYELMRASIVDPDPVVFIEHKLLYSVRSPVILGGPLIPLGVADKKRVGRDVTVVATSYMVTKALAAAERLAKNGIEAEVIDPRTLLPLDLETILTSVRATGRLVVVTEAVSFCGFSAEVAALVTEQAWKTLQAPVVRVGADFTPVPYALELEQAVLPQEEDIQEAVRRVLNQ